MCVLNPQKRTCARLDALPIEEATGLPYASKIKMKDRQGNTVPVGHMCGHDLHVTWLTGATALFAEARDAWCGTLMAVCQPAEETAEGAQAMIDDGLFKRFPAPVVILGQHVMVGPAGAVAGRTGAITSAADSLQIRLFGRGAHGSMPQASIDPVVMAAATVMRLKPSFRAKLPQPRRPLSASARYKQAPRRTSFRTKQSSS
jgi:metal-dependent amidase/aminoacylase/carboxypeptidase family protein